MKDIYQLSKIFIKSTAKNIQFDFYHNNQIILQIFKGYDVVNWRDKPNSIDNDQTVFQLLFNGGKENNKLNLLKFKNSLIFEDFVHVNFYKQETYFYGLKITDEIELVNYIEKIISSVYLFDIQKVVFTLKVY
ncbi:MULTISPECIES: hypothetical protein [unclassified Flavobacterium]|uniref:hypothetical protein n=1 Tax=unclassified Flavobacterium TaxID=196869 RepID=UPI001290C919|nr:MULTISPECIES: hypothetical protein [unclassified Flavobacterium]MQP51404.1 hypothetical protein [Flavobacterium sp. LMO9]MQP61368.1 hypothetical protein [Flavobacterium sp. LMO6]